MPDLLLVARLTVCSSYGRNVQHEAGQRFDTVQFHVPEQGEVLFRIRTFALDDDSHVFQVGRPPGDPIAVLRAHMDKIYARVLATMEVVALPTMSTQDLRAGGLPSGEL